MSRPVPCVQCGANVHEEEDVCATCNTPRDGNTQQTPVGRRSLLPTWFPTGLLLALALYGGGVWAYVRYERLNSKEYAASLKLEEAERLLGDDEGATASGASIQAAMSIYVTTLGQFPSERWMFKRVESLRWRLAERKIPLAPELERQIAFLSQQQTNASETGGSLLVAAARERWDLDEVADMPARIARFGLYGGAAIVVFYVWWRLQRRGSANRVAADLDRDHRPHSRR